MFIKRNPIVRPLLLLMTGILCQWYMEPGIIVGVIIFISGAIVYLLTGGAGARQWRLGALRGVAVLMMVFSCGMIVTNLKDVRRQPNGLLTFGKPGTCLLAVLKEHPVSKDRSYKAEAWVISVSEGAGKRPVSGNIIIYFKKDSAGSALKAGDQVVFCSSLQEIKSANNPGGFDYKRYALFNGITHQVYLTAQHYRKLPGNYLSWYKILLLNTRDYVLAAIKSNIKGQREQGLAEAMLIGYREDLDKSLLQSYSRTGVVHVIAVSGMHLALLYWIINLLLQPLLRQKKTKWLYSALVIIILWGFAFLAGGAPSVVRAAVMFTFITVGKQLNRNNSVYNTLAVSAFCLLCYNPYWLWDVGFQLSYAAVLSILIFYKPVYQLLFIRNKMLDKVWQLAAVSLAAQLLTTPFSIYYFHQFPVYFLLSNLVVVPVSTIILVGTLLLVLLAPVKILAVFFGQLLDGLIWWLNTFIEQLEQFPLAVWAGIQVSLAQAILLMIFIAGVSFWLMEKIKMGFWTAMISMLLFFCARSFSFYEATRQNKMIVYNANRATAIDFISGKSFCFFGGGEPAANALIADFVLNPSRTLHRAYVSEQFSGLAIRGRTVVFKKKRIIFMDRGMVNMLVSNVLEADVVVLSGNPRLYISQLARVIKPKQVVIDGSVPVWKASYWVRDCDSLDIACHNVATDGAFVMSLY